MVDCVFFVSSLRLLRPNYSMTIQFLRNHTTTAPAVLTFAGSLTMAGPSLHARRHDGGCDCVFD